VFIKGSDFPNELKNRSVKWRITDGGILDSPIIVNGSLIVDNNGSLFIPSGWSIPANDTNDHKYGLTVYKKCNGRFFVKINTFYTFIPITPGQEEIPEFTTMAIPALISIGGYLLIRRRKIEDS
jgi:hypothetical protein